MRRPVLLLALLAATLALPSAALASMSQESIFEDEYLLIKKGRVSALDDMQALGADTVRSVVYWADVAPSPRAAKVPAGFDPADPRAYPASAWDRYDDLVRGAAARGLKVLLTPSSPIPRWASGCKGSAAKVRACKPNPRLYGAFVRALATRYSGAYADEDQGGGVLPRVDRWSFWNEPNQPGWLNPQYVKVRGRAHLWAADRYRQLAAAGIRAVRATGHGSDVVLLGETAPIGRTTGALARRASPPVPFIGELLCLDARGRKLRGAALKAAGCKGVKALRVSGFAHHPYTRGGSQPPNARVLPGEITVSTPSRLRVLLDRGARARLVRRRLPIWYTEFGYQTNPPDRLFGVSLAQQAAFINQADYLAARQPRVKAVAQYKLVDEQDQESFQTGLVLFGSLRHKPAFAAYQLPVWVVQRGRRATVYGQVRPAPARSVQRVAIQHARSARGPWTTVKTVTVRSTTGQFLTRTAGRGGVWRLRWTPAAGARAKTSRIARAAAG
jgi:hypothetical protein